MRDKLPYGGKKQVTNSTMMYPFAQDQHQGTAVQDTAEVSTDTADMVATKLSPSWGHSPGDVQCKA